MIWIFLGLSWLVIHGVAAAPAVPQGLGPQMLWSTPAHIIIPAKEHGQLPQWQKVGHEMLWDFELKQLTLSCKV